MLRVLVVIAIVVGIMLLMAAALVLWTHVSERLDASDPNRARRGSGNGAADYSGSSGGGDGGGGGGGGG